MSSSTAKPSKAQWLEHRDLITSLYLSNEVSLKQLVNELKQHGFHATPHQVEYQLKKWNIYKNIDQTTWRYIHQQITKRKGEGKDSRVIYCGKQVKPTTIEKEISRFCDKTIFTELGLHEGSLPLAPADRQLVIRTPSPQLLPLRKILWPNSLPWLQFHAKQSRTISTLVAGVSQKQMTRCRSSISTFLSQMYGPCMNNPQSRESKLACLLRTSMPESYPDENFRRTYYILNGLQEELLYEGLLLTIFNISNGKFGHDGGMERGAIIPMLKNCKLLDLKKESLEGLRSDTVNAFLSNMFDFTAGQIWLLPLNQVDEDEILMVIEWLLALGQDPNAVLNSCHANTALQAAILAGSSRIAKCLLDANADVNFTPACFDKDKKLIGPDGEPYSCLELALNRRYNNATIIRIVDLLLEYGACTDKAQILYLAIEVDHRNLINRMVEEGADLCSTTEAREYQYFLSEETALSVAAGTGLLVTKFILDLLKSKHPSKTMTNKFVTADVLIAAAARGNDDVLRFLQPFSDGAFDNCYGATPFHIAAHYGHLSTCQLLLPSYKAYIPNVPMTFSPLQLASYYGWDLVVQFLIANGENVIAAPQRRCSLSGAEIVKRYFSYISPSPRHLADIKTFTPLDMALRGGSVVSDYGDGIPCAIMLINAGATLNGYEAVIAASHLHVDFLSLVLLKGADPNQRDEEGKSAIQCALRPHLRDKEGYPLRLYETVRLLLQYGATLLDDEVLSAIRLKTWDVLDLMLRHGGSLQETGNNGMPILEALVSSGRTLELERVVSAQPGIYDTGVLCAAIEANNDLMVKKLLLNRPAGPFLDDVEAIALGLAAAQGKCDTLRNLLAYLPAPTEPIMCRIEWPIEPPGSPARQREDWKYVGSEYYQNGWIISSTTSKPLTVAATGSMSVIEAGKKMSPQTIEACVTLLQSGFQPDKLTWIKIAEREHIALAQALRDHNHRYQDEAHVPLTNPLIPVTRYGHKEFISLLLDAGVDVNEPSITWENYRSPLQAAADIGDIVIVEHLIAAGANINAPPANHCGATALQFAAIKGHLGLAKRLIELGAEVNALPARILGRTALEGAAENGRIDMLELLIRSGVEITGTGRRYYIRAVRLATNRRFHTAAELLRRSGNWSADDQKEFDVCEISDFEFLYADEVENSECGEIKEASNGEIVHEDEDNLIEGDISYLPGDDGVGSADIGDNEGENKATGDDRAGGEATGNNESGVRQGENEDKDDWFEKYVVC